MDLSIIHTRATIDRSSKKNGKTENQDRRTKKKTENQARQSPKKKPENQARKRSPKTKPEKEDQARRPRPKTSIANSATSSQWYVQIQKLAENWVREKFPVFRRGHLVTGLGENSAETATAVAEISSRFLRDGKRSSTFHRYQ